MRLKQSFCVVHQQKNSYEKEIYKKTDNGVYQVLVEAVEENK